MAEKASKTEKVLMDMVKKGCGLQPINHNVNVVTALLANSVYSDVVINEESHGLMGYLFFSYVYTKCKVTVIDPHVVQDIPQFAFDTFGPLMVKDATVDRIYAFLSTQTFLARTYYFPHVEAIAARTGCSPDRLYKETYFDYDPEDLALKRRSLVKVEIHKKMLHRTYQQTQQFLQDKEKKKNAMEKRERKKAQERRKLGKKDLMFCDGETAHTRNGGHLIVQGRSRVCADFGCGLVLGTTYQHEDQFDEDGHAVKHVSEEPDYKPQLRRYENKKPKKAQVPLLQGDPLMTWSALDKHRKAFANSLAHFPPLPPEFTSFLKTLWDMCIDGGFSPSIRLSAKIIVGAYMIWRAVKPKSEHYLDFDFRTTDVHYFVLDDAKGNRETDMPNFFIPHKLCLPKFQPNAKTYYGSNLAQRLALLAKASISNVENMDVVKKNELRKVQVQALVTKVAANKHATAQAYADYARAQNKARTAKAKTPAMLAKAHAKNTAMLAKAQAKAIQASCPISTSTFDAYTVVPTFDVVTSFYKQDVAYHVQVRDERHISMFPSTMDSNVDVCVKVSLIFPKPRHLPNIVLMYGAQRCKLVDTQVTGMSVKRTSTFFVEAFCKTRPDFRVSFSVKSRERVMTMDQAVKVWEIHPTRSRVVMEFVPIPLVLRPMWQNVNAYLRSPVFSSIAALDQIKEAEEAEEAPTKRAKPSPPEDVESSEEEEDWL